MTSNQKLIKYVSLGFAIFLVFVILLAIFKGIYMLFTVFVDETTTFSNIELNESIKSLEIDLDYSSLVIKESNNFRIETNDKKLKIKQSNDKLIIEDNLSINNKQVILYIPKNTLFLKTSIETGAGTLNIDSIQTEKLELDLGAGKAIIKNLISNNTEIETGAGEFIIENGSINDLDFDMGVGRVEITSKITGNTKLDTGIGKLELNIIGNIDDYKFIVNKGIGQILLNNSSLSNGSVGNGNNKVYINSGIGEVKIETQN